MQARRPYDAPISRRRHRRRVLTAAGFAAGAFLLVGCDRDPGLGDLEAADTAAVLASERYAAAADPALQQQRVAAVREVVERLRSETSGGWQARQDDVTGYASELSGGRWGGGAEPVAAARDFLTRYGGAFGLQSLDGLQLPATGDYDAAGVADVRVPQVHQGVPVEGGGLLVPVSRRGSVGEISLARGRVFDVSGVETQPSVPAASAQRAAVTATGRAATGTPALVVLGDLRAPRLTWRVDVGGVTEEDPQAQAAAAGNAVSPQIPSVQGPSSVYVDARSGLILDARPLGNSLSEQRPVDLGRYDFELPPAGKPVKATGRLTDGTEVEINAEQQPDGSIVLVDATGPQADRSTRKGIIAVFDASDVPEESNAVGDVVRLPSPRITDTDALMAMWSARQAMDYFAEELGRLSFDGRNSPLIVSIRATGGEPCLDNAFFRTAPGDSRMELGVPCVEGGKPAIRTFADLSIVTHEITHGVTHTNAEIFGNTVQQGAIDEGNGDYFGVIAESRVTGRVRTAGMHYGCADGLDSEPFCAEQTAGQHGLRDINSGATYDDFLFTLSDPLGFASLLGDDGHYNSLVWTNALWKARTAVAQRDGGDLVTSKKAKAFDRAVHRATTTYLDVTTDLISGAEAVLRATGEVEGLDARDRGAVRQAFAASKLCRGCTLPPRIARFVAASGKTKVRPHVTDRGVVFTQYDTPMTSLPLLGSTESRRLQALSQEDALTVRVAARGTLVASAAVVWDEAGNGTGRLTLRDLASGRSEVLSEAVDPAVAPATDGTAVAWVDADEQERSRVLRVRTAAGAAPLRIPLPKDAAHLGISGQRVAVQYGDGELVVWDLAQQRSRRLATLGRTSIPDALRVPVGALEMDGDRIAVLADPTRRGRVIVFDLANGDVLQITNGAAPFGLGLGGDLVVWPHVIGQLPGRVAEMTRSEMPDTEIRAYSFRTGRFYRLVGQRGQQGFPSTDGRTLAWQDTVGGSDDIFSTVLPEGL